MTTKIKKTDAQLEEVLEEFSLASVNPSRQLLDQFVGQNPQFARELAELAVELALDANRDDSALNDAPEADAVSPEVAAAMSRLHNRLHSVRKAGESQKASPPSNPFSALSGDRLSAFKHEMHINSVFLMKMRDGAIEPTTIPAGFTQRTAELLGVPTDVLNSHWAGPSVIQQGSRFKSDQKPEISKQQSFAEAVATSQLTEAQQRYLLAL